MSLTRGSTVVEEKGVAVSETLSRKGSSRHTRNQTGPHVQTVARDEGNVLENPDKTVLSILIMIIDERGELGGAKLHESTGQILDERTRRKSRAQERTKTLPDRTGE